MSTLDTFSFHEDLNSVQVQAHSCLPILPCDIWSGLGASTTSLQCVFLISFERVTENHLGPVPLGSLAWSEADDPFPLALTLKVPHAQCRQQTRTQRSLRSEAYCPFHVPLTTVVSFQARRQKTHHSFDIRLQSQAGSNGYCKCIDLFFSP